MARVRTRKKERKKMTSINTFCFLYQFPYSSDVPRKLRAPTTWCLGHQQDKDPTCKKRTILLTSISLLPFRRLRRAPALESPLQPSPSTSLSLQRTNGSDILLQTQEWFPLARALDALSAFRQIRRAFAANKHSMPDDAYAAEYISDDPLAASSGQVIVGVESRYHVVYRLVNGIYMLDITVVDHNNSVNVFECIHIVNQAVSIVVTACHGVDITPKKLNRKYAEIYMALAQLNASQWINVTTTHSLHTKFPETSST